MPGKSKWLKNFSVLSLRLKWKDEEPVKKVVTFAKEWLSCCVKMLMQALDLKGTKISQSVGKQRAESRGQRAEGRR